jgi:hypothetical protein
MRGALSNWRASLVSAVGHRRASRDRHETVVAGNWVRKIYVGTSFRRGRAESSFAVHVVSDHGALCRVGTLRGA